MASALFLLLVIVCSVSGTIFSKYYNLLGGRTIYFFNAVVFLVSGICFLINSKGLTFSYNALIYGTFFAVSCIITAIFGLLAINCGPVALGSLFSSYSLLMPTFYGLIFLKDPIGKGFFIGLLFLLLSIYFINKKSQKEESVKFTVKWLIFVIIGAVGNGFCSISQKAGQLTGTDTNAMMITAYIICVIFFTAAGFVKERKLKVKTELKLSFMPVICGICNGLVNIFVIVLNKSVPAAVLFPLISCGGLIVTFITSYIAFKEKFSKIQILGFVLGVISIVMLNI